MADHQIDKTATLYNEVGNVMLRQDPDRTSENLYLLAQAGDGWVDVALFSIGADTLTWVETDIELSTMLLDLWDAEDPIKRWAAMEYEIRGTNFTTHFWFDGELPADELGFELRNELIRRRFGNLKVIYPPEPAH